MISLMKNNRRIKRFRKVDTLFDYISKNIVKAENIKFERELTYIKFNHLQDTYSIIY